MWPRHASLHTCVVLMGASEGCAGPRVLVWTRCRCCDTKWSCGIIIVKILHSVEGRDVEQVTSNLRTILCVCDCSSLSHLCLYILHAYIIYLLTWLIYLCLINIYLGLFAHTCINQERHSGTSTLNLKKSWGDSLEPFTGNSATLLCHTLCI